MTIRDAYNTWAATYDTDRNLTRDLDAQVTRATLVGQPAARILELGCGTGKNTAFLAQLGGRVLALDFAEGMIRQAQARVPAAHVGFAVADLTRPWPVAAGTVDLAVCNLVLEHIADLGFIFAEAARCLAPGGRLFVAELHPFKQYQGSKAVYGPAQARAQIPAFVHHISAFLDAASAAGLTLLRLKEWWHAEDAAAPPRLVSFLFQK
jgi:malonyl-CoA O-methyltransferase